MLLQKGLKQVKFWAKRCTLIGKTESMNICRALHTNHFQHLASEISIHSVTYNETHQFLRTIAQHRHTWMLQTRICVQEMQINVYFLGLWPVFRLKIVIYNQSLPSERGFDAFTCTVFLQFCAIIGVPCFKMCKCLLAFAWNSNHFPFSHQKN